MNAQELRIGNSVLRNGFLPEHKEVFNEIIVNHNDITACVFCTRLPSNILRHFIPLKRRFNT